MVKDLRQPSGLAWFCARAESCVVFNTGPYTVLPDNSIWITANMQLACVHKTLWSYKNNSRQPMSFIVTENQKVQAGTIIFCCFSFSIVILREFLKRTLSYITMILFLYSYVAKLRNQIKSWNFILFYLFLYKKFTVKLKVNKNSSGDEIANVNFYAVRPRSYRNSLK